jgi:hypothetical protein
LAQEARRELAHLPHGVLRVQVVCLTQQLPLVVVVDVELALLRPLAVLAVVVGLLVLLYLVVLVLQAKVTRGGIPLVVILVLLLVRAEAAAQGLLAIQTSALQGEMVVRGQHGVTA